MLLFVIGLPGGFTDWCANVAARYAERMAGTGERISANSLAELAHELIRHRTASGIVRSTSPNGPLRAALVEAGRNFVVAVGDPRQAIADLTVKEAFDFPAALRQVASSCAAIHSLGALSGDYALILRSEMPGPETAFAIGAHLAAGFGDAEFAAVAKDGAAGIADAGIDIEAWWSALTQEERAAADGALGAYLNGDATRTETAILWGAELFHRGDTPDQPATGVIDVTGLPRSLLEGPDILLPPGRWSLSIGLWFSAPAVEHEYLVEVFGCDPPQRHVIRPPQNGQFEGAGEITIPEASEMPLKIRLSTMRAAFDGTVRLRGARLQRPG